MSLLNADKAIAAVARGDTVIVVDDDGEEPEGYLVAGARFATPDRIAFFVKSTSGLVCAPITEERAAELELPVLVPAGPGPMVGEPSLTVDYREGTTTGISSADRAATVRALVDPGARPGDFTSPGHIHVLRAKAGGVLTRAGHVEAAVDLARLADLEPAAVLCEIVTDDGLDMARLADLERFADRHGMATVSIAELVRYRRQNDKLIRRLAEARIPTPWGDFTAYAYENVLNGDQHVAFVKGAVQGQPDVLVRMHSECLTGDVFGSLKCDCGAQLEAAMRRIGDAGLGVVVYLRGHEGRGIGIANKLAAYGLQERGLDTVDANLELGLPVDRREYGIGAQILVDLGITTMRYMTNNPAKVAGLKGFGLTVSERIPLTTVPNPENYDYLRTKKERMGHFLGDLGDGDRGPA